MPKLNSFRAVYQYLFILKEREQKILKICQQKIDKSNYKKVRLSYYLIIKIRDRQLTLIAFLKAKDPTLQLN